jgi:hypothetical protein
MRYRISVSSIVSVFDLLANRPLPYIFRVQRPVMVQFVPYHG